MSSPPRQNPDPLAQIAVGRHAIGGGDCFVIAELGVNHGGSIERAVELVDAAADAGADAVKLQTFDADHLVSDDAPLATYQQRSGGAGGQRELLDGLQLSAAGHSTVLERARERGVVFLSTPFDVASADLLVGLGVPAIKVGSGELTNLPFLRQLAGRALPLLVSTGMATIDEVDAAVHAIAEGGDPPLALLHCVSSYPADPVDVNLRAMRTMAERYRVPIGFSDHTTGIEVAIAAVALGAAILEKHLTLDRSAAGPDHAASLEPDDFAAMVHAVRTVAAALGDGRKVPVAAEADVAAAARRSVAVSRDLPAGHVIGEEDLVLLRPGTGMSPASLSALVGRRLRVEVRARTLLRPDDLA